MAGYVVGVPSVVKLIKVKRPGRELEEFSAEIRVHDMDEQDAIYEKQMKGELSDNSLVREDVLSMWGFEDAKGNEVEADEALTEKIFKDPFALMALVRAWTQVQQGVQEATEKN